MTGSCSLSSDGIGTTGTGVRYPGLVWSRIPNLMAGVLYRDFSRGNDDATVVVAATGRSAFNGAAVTIDPILSSTSGTNRIRSPRGSAPARSRGCWDSKRRIRRGSPPPSPRLRAMLSATREAAKWNTAWNMAGPRPQCSLSSASRTRGPGIHDLRPHPRRTLSSRPPEWVWESSGARRLMDQFEIESDPAKAPR